MTLGLVGRCLDCEGEFTAVDGSERFCGNCAASRHLPRCGRLSIVPVFSDQPVSDMTVPCVRPRGHTGHCTYGKRRA